MTSIPQRIALIRPVIESVLGQTVKVDRLELNIPVYSIRFKENYIVPGWFAEYQGISVYRTSDYGPITKIAPTLVRYRGDPDSYIWSIDDDCVYPTNQLELLCKAFDPEKRRILARYGGRLNDDGAVQHWYGKGEVNFIEGFGGVLYPPGCIADDFEDYVNVTSENEYCRKGDDIVLSMYFSKTHMPMYLYNVPSEAPYHLFGAMRHAESNALSAGGLDETYDNYKKIFHFINSIWPTLRARVNLSSAPPLGA